MKYIFKITRFLPVIPVSLLFIFLIFADPESGVVENVYADSTNLIVTSCDLNDIVDSTCLSAVTADGGTETSFTKNQHFDMAFQTMEVASITSATLYYDSYGTLSGSWGVYVKDARDGNTICSVDPAPEDGSETRNSLSCSITTTQLNNGVWLYMINNDTAGPEYTYIDYVYLALEYTAGVSISISSDGSVGFGTQTLNTTVDTTASGLNDIEVVSVDTGPADLDIRSSQFTDSTYNWSFSSSNGSDQILFEFSKDGSSWSTFLVADTLYTFDTNVAQSATRNIYFRLTTPTYTTSYEQYGATITVVASAP